MISAAWAALGREERWPDREATAGRCQAGRVTSEGVAGAREALGWQGGGQAEGQQKLVRPVYQAEEGGLSFLYHGESGKTYKGWGDEIRTF